MNSNVPRTTTPKTGYSATVEMSLEIDGVKHDVSHMGPEFVILAKPQPHPPMHRRGQSQCGRQA